MKIKIGDNSLKLRAGASTDNIDRGPRGYSAYEVAVQNGYTGTEEEWLLSLKGPKGDTGLKGERGLQGPRGQQGIQGEPGPSNSLSIGNVTKGEVPSASITGESPNQVLNLTLPKGDKGDEGPRGLQGTQGPQGPKGEQGPKGDTGESGVWTKKETPPAGYKVWITPDGEAGTIPTKVSELENDAHYVTEEDVEDFTSIYVGKREDAPESSKIVIEETNTPNSLGDASGTTIGITDSADAEVVNYKQYGITKQETSTRSINYCPDIDKWSLNNGAYIENGYIVLPKNMANAISPLIPIDKQQYFWFAYAKIYTEIENNKVLCYTRYYDGNKKQLNENGNARSIETVSVDNNYYWTFGGGSETQYGQALYNAKYIRILFAYSSNFSNGAYKIKCPMITSERQPTFVPYVPNMPSPDYPSEIEVATGSVSAKSTGKNLANIKNIPNKTGDPTINVTNNTIVLSNVSNTSGYTNTQTKLKELCPSLQVGDVAYLFFNTTSISSSKNIIYIGESWTENGSKTITQAMLDSNVVLYGGYNETAIISNFMITKVNDATYEPYKESSITYNLGDNFLADKDYIENGVLNKHIVKILLDGSDNHEQWSLYSNDDEGISFALWKNGMKLGFGVSLCDKYKNVKHAWESKYKNSYGIYSDHMGSYAKYFRPPNANITTVEQWKAWLKENPITMYYEIETPKQIQLETTGELRTFEPNTIITNSLDSQMEVEYKGNKDLEFYIKSGNHFLKWLG